MHKPEDLIEIYLTAGEFQCGDAEMRVRTLLGEGGIFTLWHPRRRIGCIDHFRAPARATPSPQLAACRALGSDSENRPRRGQFSTISPGNGRTIAQEMGEKWAGAVGLQPEIPKPDRLLNPAYADEALALAMFEMGRARTRPREYVGRLFVHDDAGSSERLDAVRDLLDFHGVPIKTEFTGRGNLVFDLWNGEVWMQKKAPAVARAGKNPEDILEVYLHPGEWHFGDEDTRIKTLLGSCVSFTLWHPERRIGGMCHYMLPSREGRRTGSDLDGKYADEALHLLVREIEKENTRPRDYTARVFGGGSMLDIGGLNVSERNVETARKLIKHYGFRLEGECLGGVGHRNVVFDVWSGEVWLKKGEK